MVETFRNVTALAISGQCYSGKSTLCRILSEKLNWVHIYIGNEFRKLAKLQSLEIERFGSIPNTLLRQIDEQIRQRMKTEKNVIWDGRLACYLARDSIEVFKIYCVANLDVRAKRAAFRDKIPFEKAKEKILVRDSEELNVFKRLYGLSTPYDSKWVDLLIDTSVDLPVALSSIVIQALCGKSSRANQC